MVKIQPLDDRLIVEPCEAEAVTPGGIVLPDAAKEKQSRGRVLAIGNGRLLDNGTRAGMSVDVGDEVFFNKYGGSDIELDDVVYKVLRECDVLAVVQ